MLIPEYIGSAFDKIIAVADNIDHIKEIAAGIEDYLLMGISTALLHSQG